MSAEEIIPANVVRLLSALKGVYTFKELESYLNVPSQLLWRYIKHLSVPERSTAKKIISEIEEHDLVKRAIAKIVEFNKYGFIETWKINRNIHVLNLFAYLIYTYIKSSGDKVDSIVPLTIEGIPIATVLSDWIEKPMYILYTEPYLTMEKRKAKAFIKSGECKMSEVYLPAGAFEKGNKVLLTDLVAPNACVVNSTIELILDMDAVPWGIAIAILDDDNWIKGLRGLVKNVFVIFDATHLKSANRAAP